jgi:hypothetical protein
MTTRINITVDAEGLLNRNAQQQAASRQANQQRIDTEKAAVEGQAQLEQERVRKGLDPATGEPLISAGSSALISAGSSALSSSRIRRIDQEPAANRRGPGEIAGCYVTNTASTFNSQGFPNEHQIAFATLDGSAVLGPVSMGRSVEVSSPEPLPERLDYSQNLSLLKTENPEGVWKEMRSSGFARNKTPFSKRAIFLNNETWGSCDISCATGGADENEPFPWDQILERESLDFFGGGIDKLNALYNHDPALNEGRNVFGLSNNARYKSFAAWAEWDIERAGSRTGETFYDSHQLPAGGSDMIYIHAFRSVSQSIDYKYKSIFTRGFWYCDEKPDFLPDDYPGPPYIVEGGAAALPTSGFIWQENTAAWENFSFFPSAAGNGLVSTTKAFYITRNSIKEINPAPLISAMNILSPGSTYSIEQNVFVPGTGLVELPSARLFQRPFTDDALSRPQDLSNERSLLAALYGLPFFPEPLGYYASTPCVWDVMADPGNVDKWIFWSGSFDSSISHEEVRSAWWSPELKILYARPNLQKGLGGIWQGDLLRGPFPTGFTLNMNTNRLGFDFEPPFNGFYDGLDGERIYKEGAAWKPVRFFVDAKSRLPVLIPPEESFDWAPVWAWDMGQPAYCARRAAEFGVTKPTP